MSKVQWMSKDLWIIAAGFIAAMHVGKLPVVIPTLQADMGVSLVQAGLLMSLVQAAGMCFALILGSYAEKIGLKRCMMFGLILLTSASTLAAFYPSLTILFITRVVEGFGFLMVTLTGAALLRQLVATEQLALKMGLWTAYMGGGIGIILVLAPILLQHATWQAVWLSLALVSSLACLAIAYWIPSPAKSTQNLAVQQLIKTTLKHPPAWYLAFIFGTYAGQWFALVSFLPVIYAENQIPITTAGLLTASVAAANAVGTFICGLLLQRGFKAQTLVQTGFVILASCALSFYGLKDHLPFVVQFLLVFGFSLFGGLVASTVFSQALTFAPNSRSISTTIGLILQNSAISQFSLPPLIAWLVTQTQTWLYVGVFMACLSCLGIWLTHQLFQWKNSPTQ